MTLPDDRLDIMAKEDFGAWRFPRNNTSGHQKITDDDIVSFFLKQIPQSLANQRPAILRQAVRFAGEKAGDIVDKFRESLRAR
jgi:hypothetical protein